MIGKEVDVLIYDACEGYKPAGKRALPQELSWKAGLFGEIHIPQTELGLSQKVRVCPNMGWLVFMGWVIP